MQGRNSSCINIRLELADIRLLTDKALSKGFETPGTYVKAVILESLHSATTIPIYRKGVDYEAGSMVRYKGKILKVPETDIDGNVMWEE